MVIKIIFSKAGCIGVAAGADEPSVREAVEGVRWVKEGCAWGLEVALCKWLNLAQCLSKKMKNIDSPELESTDLRKR